MSSLSTLIFRNNIVESQHSIKCYIGSLNGNTIFSTENTNDLIYPRSSIKIFQGIPFSDSKAIDFFKLNKKPAEYSLDNFIGPIYGKWVMNGENIYHKTIYDFDSLKKLLMSVGFKNVSRYDWRETSHSEFDDHSQAYIPHMDKENGTHISLNIQCSKK